MGILSGKGNLVGVVFLMFILLFVGGCSRSSNKAEDEVILFSSADSDGSFGFSNYFTLYFKGNTLVTWSDTNADIYDIEWQVLDLSQPVMEGQLEYITKLAYAPYENDLIIVFQMENSEYGGSSAARIDGETLKPKWVSAVASFNLGKPIIKGNGLYVTTIGAIGKINVDTGEFFWKHTDLYDQETQDFNSFKMPVFSGTKVIFQGEIYNTCPKRVEVNDADGTILGTIETCPP
jgi:hypothetical protein